VTLQKPKAKCLSFHTTIATMSAFPKADTIAVGLVIAPLTLATKIYF
jgi:hypothetical protein